MKTSANGIAFIIANEGYTPKPKDDNGHLMWGHGHDRRGFELVPDYISLADSGALLAEDLPLYFEPHVNELAPWANQNQFDALVDFCYNLGPGALATMLHHGQDQVEVQILAWCYEHVNGVLRINSGLIDRRTKELKLYGS
jgi:GH24 family phage-related lysozyme (muramidase)